MAILAYFGPLVLIPIFAAKDSKFARYHSNQGLMLLITSITYGIAYSIFSSIILAIIGIINAATGKAKELPLIRKIKNLK